MSAVAARPDRCGHGTGSKPLAKTTSSGPLDAGTSVATSYEAGEPLCATCNVAEPATGADVVVIEYEYSVPQSSVPPSGAVQVTAPSAVLSAHKPVVSRVPLLKVVAPI